MNTTIVFAEIARAVPYFIDTVLPHLKSELFSDDADRAVFKILTGHRDKYGQPPSVAEARAYADKIEDQDTLEEATALIDAIYKVESIPSPEYVKEEAQQFIRIQTYAIANEKTNKAIMDGKGEDEIRAHLENAKVAWDFKFAAETCRGLRLDPVTICQMEQDNPPRMYLKSIVGGPSMARKELAILFAEATGGKSGSLTHIGCDFLRQGMNVLYITLENSEWEANRRAVSNLIQHDKQKLRDLTPAEVGARLPLEHRNLRVVYYEPHSSHAGDFELCINNFIRIEGFVPDVLIIDYLGRCGAQKPQGKSATEYQIFGAVSGELRSLAIKYNMLVWTAGQLNRDANGKRPTRKNISDSLKMLENADVALLLAPENGTKLLYFKTEKNRNDENNCTEMILESDWSMMTLRNIDDPNEVLNNMNMKPAKRKSKAWSK